MDSVNSIAPEGARQCSCSKSARSSTRVVKWTTAGGMLAAMGVCAACCLLPFALLGIGVASGWVSTLDALAPYKWIFVGLTAALLGYGFYAAYWKPRRTCAAGTACEVLEPVDRYGSGCGLRRSSQSLDLCSNKSNLTWLDDAERWGVFDGRRTCGRCAVQLMSVNPYGARCGTILAVVIACIASTVAVALTLLATLVIVGSQ
jgi:hypothetical protein